VAQILTRPGASPGDRQAIADLTAKGLLGRLVFATDDCDAVFEHIRPRAPR